jgi:hypothetical protein
MPTTAWQFRPHVGDGLENALSAETGGVAVPQFQCFVFAVDAPEGTDAAPLRLREAHFGFDGRIARESRISRAVRNSMVVFMATSLFDLGLRPVN